MEKSTQSGSELLKQISVLDTIFWINRAWKAIDATTIMKCFDKCGFEKVRQTPIETESHSDCDSDDDIPLIKLARSQSIYGTGIREIINDDIPTCDNSEIDWNLPATELLNVNVDSDSDSEHEGNEPENDSKQKVCSILEARECIEKLRNFACDKGNAKLLGCVMEVSSIVSDMNFKTMTVQAKISDFLTS
ncbi:uncharacterized protein LOC128549569 [Mercenaria mercenaria]|uniref:uncharacterized protein LOC128549569 n=1 Tax=Mercenaria mercenaria TaxID=6596 RepID=UPI00234F79AF|nr:uncharacterized protein LOC128549569 [Mercenaria mercenaria]